MTKTKFKGFCGHSLSDRRKAIVDEASIHQGELYFNISTMCKCGKIFSAPHYGLPMEFVEGIEVEACHYSDLEKEGKEEWDKIKDLEEELEEI